MLAPLTDVSAIRRRHDQVEALLADASLREELRSQLARVADLDRLQEIGVITGFTAQIDHAKLGWGVEAFTELRYAGTTRVADIVATASTVPEVQSIFTIAGDPDALVRVRVRDVAHLQEVIDTLRTAGTVTGTKTLLVLGAWNRGAS